jgi:hypothetical protein
MVEVKGIEQKIGEEDEPEMPDDKDIYIKEFRTAWTQTDLVLREAKKKSTKKIIKRVVKNDPSEKLLEVLEKTRREKEKLENSIINESRAYVDANNLVKLSMKYVTKAMSGYNRFFVTGDSKNNSLSRIKNPDERERSESNETIALRMKTEALASSHANQLLKSNMFMKLIKRQEINKSTDSLPKRKRSNKLIRRKKLSSSNPSLSPQRSLPKSKSRNQIALSNRYALFQPSHLRTHSRPKSRHTNSEAGRSLSANPEEAKSGTYKKRKKRIVRRVVKQK